MLACTVKMRLSLLPRAPALRNCRYVQRFSERFLRDPELRGGGRGIRTPGTVSRTAVFKTACFNHSHIPPRECEERTHCLRLSLQQGIRAQDECVQALVTRRRERPLTRPR